MTYIHKACENKFLLADDAKIFRVIESFSDVVDLQEDIIGVMDWFARWKMRVNLDKCCLLRVGKQDQESNYRLFDSEGKSHVIPLMSNISDLGIIVDCKLQFKEHINNRIKKARSLLGVIARNFRYLTEKAFMCLYKSLIRTQLEYGVQVWSPHQKGLVKVIESVQRRATKLVLSCKGLTYVERLKLLKLPSLVYRRKQADLILLFNMVSGRIQEPQCPVLNSCWDGRTRGHDSKLSTRLAHKDCRKFFFTNRVVHDWNNLPQSVVSSPDVATLRILLDHH